MTDAILDGEIIVLDKNGVSQFNSLLSHKGENVAVFYAFDLIRLNGSDLRQLPLAERKAQLRALVIRSGCQRLLYAQHVNGAGKQFFAELCRLDLEGIVAKRKQSIYKDDGNSWQKIKTAITRRLKVGTNC